MPHRPPRPRGCHPQHGQPRPGSNVTYVPTQIRIPVPRPPPRHHHPAGATIINNYYYGTPGSQPPQPQPVIHPVQPTQPIVQPVSLPVDWASATKMTAVNYSHRAFVAGKDLDGTPLWIIRAHHGGEFVPGKLVIRHKGAYIPYNGKEVPVENFEILLASANAVRWKPSSNGQIPHDAIVAGNTQTAEPLYIGRVSHQRTMTPGKIHPSHGCCYVPFGGNELPFKQYEVLCKV
ncbi:hypothetical protein ACJJTC_016185 [Scirpophaga incertulas]